MNFRKDTKEFERRTDELDKVKIRCEWCGHWVFRDKREKFKYKIKNMMKGNK